MKGPYVILTFENKEDFELYRKSVKLQLKHVALSEDHKLVALINTEVIIPSGFLTAKTKSGREIIINVSSGYANNVQTSE